MGRPVHAGSRRRDVGHYRPAMAARLVLRADLPAAELALARAFRDDPMTAWLTGVEDPAAREAVARFGFFAPGLAAGFPRGHCYVVAGEEATEPAGDPVLGGAAVWSPPDVELFGEAEGAAFATALVAACGESAIERLMALAELTGSRHPHDRPHFYLFLLGAAVHGRGAGSELLQPVLERCDADGLPAYLESSSARNVSFYERHGFRVQWEAAPDGGPTLRGMWREPGTGRG